MRLPEIDLNLHLPKPPFALVAGFLILVVLSWVPLVMLAKSRVTIDAHPRVHLIEDMDHQPKKLAQSLSPLFADGRAMRQPVPGTVARGELHADDHYWRGYRTKAKGAGGRGKPDGKPQYTTTYFKGFPDRVTVDRAFVKRGQTEFNVYCFPCHGKDGTGDGPVQHHAQGTPGWVPPANLIALDNKGRLQYGPGNYPNGEVFNTISNGFNNMPAYRDQIRTRDRWAIVAYVRALQLSQHATRDELAPRDIRRLNQSP